MSKLNPPSVGCADTSPAGGGGKQHRALILSSPVNGGGAPKGWWGDLS